MIVFVFVFAFVFFKCAALAVSAKLWQLAEIISAVAVNQLPAAGKMHDNASNLVGNGRDFWTHSGDHWTQRRKQNFELQHFCELKEARFPPWKTHKTSFLFVWPLCVQLISFKDYIYVIILQSIRNMWVRCGSEQNVVLKGHCYMHICIFLFVFVYIIEYVCVFLVRWCDDWPLRPNVWQTGVAKNGHRLCAGKPYTYLFLYFYVHLYSYLYLYSKGAMIGSQ